MRWNLTIQIFNIGNDSMEQLLIHKPNPKIRNEGGEYKIGNKQLTKEQEAQGKLPAKSQIAHIQQTGNWGKEVRCKQKQPDISE